MRCKALCQCSCGHMLVLKSMDFSDKMGMHLSDLGVETMLGKCSTKVRQLLLTLSFSDWPNGKTTRVEAGCCNYSIGKF